MFCWKVRKKTSPFNTTSCSQNIGPYFGCMVSHINAALNFLWFFCCVSLSGFSGGLQNLSTEARVRATLPAGWHQVPEWDKQELDMPQGCWILQDLWWPHFSLSHGERLKSCILGTRTTGWVWVWFIFPFKMEFKIWHPHMGTLPFDPPVLTWSSTLVTWLQHGTWQARQLLPHTKGLFGAKCIESCQQSSMKIRLTTCISIMTHCCLKFASQGRISKVGLFREIFSVWIYLFCCREIIIQCSRMELQRGKKSSGNPE